MDPTIRFAILADTHINLSFPFAKRTRQLRKALDHIANDSTIHGVFLCGDLSDHGLSSQLESFAYEVQTFKQKSHKEAYVVIGNHDLNHYLPLRLPVLETMNELRTSLKESQKSTMYEEKNFQDIVILMLNSEERIQTDSALSCEQILWLSNRLFANSDKKVVLILHHQPLTYTHMGSETYGLGKQDDMVKHVLEQYENAVWISGHIHNGPTTIKPCVNRFGLQLDVPSFQLTRWHGGHTGCGLLLSIQGDIIVMQVYDFLQAKGYQSFIIDITTKQIMKEERIPSTSVQKNVYF